MGGVVKTIKKSVQNVLDNPVRAAAAVYTGGASESYFQGKDAYDVATGEKKAKDVLPGLAVGNSIRATSDGGFNSIQQNQAVNSNVTPTSEFAARVADSAVQDAISPKKDPAPDTPATPGVSSKKTDIQALAQSIFDDTQDPLDRIRRRAKTLLTGGLGISDKAPVVRKTLLGGGK